MKKKKDAVLDYMLELGISPAKSPAAAREALRKLGMLDKLRDASETAAEEEAACVQNFYSAKNEDPEKAVYINGIFGGDVLRRGFSSSRPARNAGS